MKKFWPFFVVILSALVLSSSCKKEEAKACFTYSVNGTTVSFNSGCSEHASTYLWEFGINVTSIAPNPTIDYGSDGNYQVTLQISGANGEDTVEMAVVVDNSFEEECVDCHCSSDFVNWESTIGSFCGSPAEVEAWCNSSSCSLGSGYTCVCQ